MLNENTVTEQYTDSEALKRVFEIQTGSVSRSDGLNLGVQPMSDLIAACPAMRGSSASTLDLAIRSLYLLMMDD